MSDGDEDERPPRLDYRRPVPGSDAPATPAVVQFMAGVGLWVLVLAAGVGVVRMAGRPLPDLLTAAVSIAVGGSLAVAVVVRARFNWRAFLPGVLVGIGLTCLVPVGIVIVVCGPWSR